MKTNKLLIISISLALGLNACTNIKSIPTKKESFSVDYIDIQRHIDSANTYFKSHEFYQSLMQWKILHSIQPENEEYKNRILVLNALIERRIKKHKRSIDIALKNKNYETVKSELFNILLLNPDNQDAITRLKTIEANTVIKRQARRTKKYLLRKQESQENNGVGKQSNKQDITTFRLNKKDNVQALFYLELGLELFDKNDWRGSVREINKYLATNPTDTKAKDILITSHIKLSEIFEDRGHLEPAIQHLEDAISIEKPSKQLINKLKALRHKLSSNYYIEGVKVYRDNIDQAIIYWKRAVTTNPDNIKAKIRLKKARKIKEKLNEIKQK